MSLIVNERESEEPIADSLAPCSSVTWGYLPWGYAAWMPTDTPKSNPPELLRWKNAAEQNQSPAGFSSFSSKSNSGPVFGFEMTNDDSVAYASMA
jgi:hypothetical protein